MTLPCPALRSSPSSEGSIPPMSGGRRIWTQDADGRQRKNFKKCSTIAASFLPIRSALWRTCNWGERSPLSEKQTGQGGPTGASWPSGKTPTPISPCSSRLARNTRSYSHTQAALWKIERRLNEAARAADAARVCRLSESSQPMVEQSCLQSLKFSGFKFGAEANRFYTHPHQVENVGNARLAQ